MDKRTDLVWVTDVYGDKCRISLADFEGPRARRNQIPLYNRNGIKVSDSRSWKPGDCSSIIRENIVKVHT